MNKRPGRPPAGPKGEYTSKYPQLTLRVRPETRDTLRAVAALERRNMALVVTDALAQYVASLEPVKRRALHAFGRG